MKRACRKQVIQNHTAYDVKHYHSLIVQEITDAGFSFWDGTDGADARPAQGHFACEHCDKIFPTAQALGAHAFQIRGQSSEKRKYIQSTICPGCLRDHHTTWRVQQHLRYRQNGCWDRIHGARLPDDPVTIHLPAHLRHVKRLPAVRRHYGPIRPTSVQRQRTQLRQRRLQGRHCGFRRSRRSMLHFVIMNGCVLSGGFWAPLVGHDLRVMDPTTLCTCIQDDDVLRIFTTLWQRC